MQTKLTPVLHPTLSDHHRVPMAEVDGKFEIYVGEDFVRILKEEDLPDIFKVRLAMIRAATDSNSLSNSPILIAKAYEHPRESQLFEIGWQVCEGLYVIVIPTKDLTYLRTSNYAPTAYRHMEGFGFIADDKPSFIYLQDFVGYYTVMSTIGKFGWHQPLKEKLKRK